MHSLNHILKSLLDQAKCAIIYPMGTRALSHVAVGLQFFDLSVPLLMRLSYVYYRFNLENFLINN